MQKHNRVQLHSKHKILCIALLGATAFTCGPIGAQTQPPAMQAMMLSPEQVASLQAQLRSSIERANGDQNAISHAISDATVNSVKSYGTAYSGSVTTAVLMGAEQSKVAGYVIGQGLGEAGCNISNVDRTAGQASAQAIANTGKSDEISAYSATTSQMCPVMKLASIAENGATATAAIPGGLTAGGGAPAAGFGATAAGGGGGVCLNASCTR